ncbi:tetratricopeptide repeat protein 29-like [Watersipora subatra]|uniref:tetratricopeptide repeat protein 29-like n=1 Tax=Watersipora subatra TaxID=2589382 RepID=UPI00355B0A20
MATVLPHVRTPNSAMSRVDHNEHALAKSPTGSSKSRPGTALTVKSFKLKNANRKEQEIMLRRERLRDQQPFLSKAETAAYRHSYKHNLCLDMLQAGFHRTFSELHALMLRQSTMREAAGPDSVLWNIPLLETEHDKLDSIKFYLTEAEEAIREGDLKRVYKNRFGLALYFQGRGDKWLSDHFFQTCLEVSSDEEDGQQRLCEALCFVGLAMEENGELFDTAERFEEYYTLSKEKSDWRTETGKAYHTDACDHLTRIYTKISDSLAADEKELRVEYLLKAYNTAKEGGDESSAGEAAYRLGLAYIKMSDAKTAQMYLKMYMETCESRNDDIGVGKACEAIARAYDSEGKTAESLKFLVRFVEVAEKSGQDLALATACQNLGYIYNSRGDYAEARKYFSKAFSLSQAKNNRAATESSSVYFGIAHALGMMRGVKSHLTMEGKLPMSRLIGWKNQRQEEFAKPFVMQVKDESKEAIAPPEDTL